MSLLEIQEIISNTSPWFICRRREIYAKHLPLSLSLSCDCIKGIIIAHSYNNYKYQEPKII